MATIDRLPRPYRLAVGRVPADANAGQTVADLSGLDEVVVFVIGMRIHRWRKVRSWWPAFTAMPKMLAELQQDPDQGMLAARGGTHTVPRPVLAQRRGSGPLRQGPPAPPRPGLGRVQQARRGNRGRRVVPRDLRGAHLGDRVPVRQYVAVRARSGRGCGRERADSGPHRRRGSARGHRTGLRRGLSRQQFHAATYLADVGMNHPTPSRKKRSTIRMNSAGLSRWVTWPASIRLYTPVGSRDIALSASALSMAP